MIDDIRSWLLNVCF